MGTLRRSTAANQPVHCALQFTGYNYGGDGVTTFGLPDLRSRVPVGAGQGTGLSPYNLCQIGGSENVTLTANTIASHTHQATGLSATVLGVNTTGTTNQPGPSVVLAAPTDAARNPVNIYSNAAANQNLGPGTVTGSVAPAGGGQPHLNLQPYQALNYIVALVGIYPLAKLAWIAHSPLNRSFA